MTRNRQLLNEVAAFYDWLDCQTRRYNKPEILCSVCGKCCKFKEFGHLLFVTGPELIFLAANRDDKLRKMPDDICPYNKWGKCTVYRHRFSGCRIYNCHADKDFQAVLSESAVKKLKSICETFDIPYRYTDLKTALENFNG